MKLSSPKTVLASLVFSGALIATTASFAVDPAQCQKSLATIEAGYEKIIVKHESVDAYTMLKFLTSVVKFSDYSCLQWYFSQPDPDTAGKTRCQNLSDTVTSFKSDHNILWAIAVSQLSDDTKNSYNAFSLNVCKMPPL